MIDIKELCIGNYVFLDDITEYPMFVIGLDSYGGVTLDFEGNEGDCIDTTNKDICPIKLDEELFNNLQFSENQSSGYTVFEKTFPRCQVTLSEISNSKDRDYYCHIDNLDFETIGSSDIQYLHQLQNIIKHVSGDELKIDRFVFLKNKE